MQTFKIRQWAPQRLKSSQHSIEKVRKQAALAQIKSQLVNSKLK